MLGGEDAVIRDGSRSFIEELSLNTIVPYASNIDIEEVLSAASGRDDDLSSVLDSIKQRQSLFFDETVTVYVVLLHPSVDALRTYLSRIVITVTAFAFNRPLKLPHNADGASHNQSRDAIWSESVDKSGDPVIVVHRSETGGNGTDKPHVYAIWRLDAFLGRPRMRIQSPIVISFSADASLRPSAQAITTVKDDYLPSKIPAELNLLGALNDDAALAGAQPRLSAMRVSRVVPASSTAREPSQLRREYDSQPFPAIPAISSRIRYSSLTASANKPVMIASIDFDVTSLAGCEVDLQEIQLRLSDGVVQEYKGLQGAGLPVTCSPRDELTFLYHLTQNAGVEVTSSQNANIKTLEILIIAVALISADCTPRIAMKWRTSVDFSAPLNPNFGTPRQLIQRNHRPSSLPVTSVVGTVPTSAAPTPSINAQGPALLTGKSGRQRTDSVSDFGVTATFSGPRNVYVGETFRWQVFVVNRSNQDRKLALVVILRRGKIETKRHAYRTSSSSVSGHKVDLIAEAVVDENIVYTLQRSAITDPAELVNLSTDVRIGPLAPAACHTADLRFLALAKGVLHLEAIRLVDVATNESTDIQNLPSIVCLPKESTTT